MHCDTKIQKNLYFSVVKMFSWDKLLPTHPLRLCRSDSHTQSNYEAYIYVCLLMIMCVCTVCTRFHEWTPDRLRLFVCLRFSFVSHLEHRNHQLFISQFLAPLRRRRVPAGLQITASIKAGRSPTELISQNRRSRLRSPLDLLDAPTITLSGALTWFTSATGESLGHWCKKI